MAHGRHFGISQIQKVNDLELKHDVAAGTSWHDRYKDSAYIHVGGLHMQLTEGDVITIFSQFGEIVDINLVRDRETGKSTIRDLHFLHMKINEVQCMQLII